MFSIHSDNIEGNILVSFEVKIERDKITDVLSPYWSQFQLEQ